MRLRNGTWLRGPRLANADVAGFGSVYEAMGPNRELAVAKFVPKAPGADRELLIGDALSLSQLSNVVPILDYGEVKDSWVLVMPRANTSLSKYLIDRSGQLDLVEVVRILTDIAVALDQIGEQVVHRDLKPANVLELNGVWCLADFGIARYVEATTDAETRKFSMTYAYAAPEQWRAERATPATDVYAFGVMAYELVAGHRPFPGPEAHDFRAQHIEQPAPPLTGGTARLRTLIEECLMKRPEARPRPANLIARLEKAALEPARPGLARLAQVNQAEVARRTKEQSEHEARQEEAQRRNELFDAASQLFGSFWQPLVSWVEDEAPTAVVNRNSQNRMLFVAEIAGARLGVSNPEPTKWGGPFTVIASSVIYVGRSQPNNQGWEGRSHSLWYCDAERTNEFGWYELAFMASPFGRGQPSVEPYSRDPSQATAAFNGVIGTEQLGWPVELLNRDDPDEFVDRWLGWFADAVAGTLARPWQMPEKPIYQPWRIRK